MRCNKHLDTFFSGIIQLVMSTHQVILKMSTFINTIQLRKSVEYLYFEVQASNDVHIGLSPIAGDADPMYEIVIGGWGNAQSVIRRCKQVSDCFLLKS